MLQTWQWFKKETEAANRLKEAKNGKQLKLDI